VTKKYTLESITIEAQKYSFRKEFEQNARPYYAAAHRNGWLNQVCQHMQQTVTNWTKDLVLSKTVEADNISDFIQKYSGAYKHAVSNGYLKELKSAFPSGPKIPHNKKWTKESVLDIAKQCESYTTFRKTYRHAYMYASKVSMLPEVQAIIPKAPREPVNKKWSFDLCVDKMAECKTRNEFNKKYSGAAKYLSDRGLVDQAFSAANIGYATGTSECEAELLEWVRSLGINAVNRKKFGRELEIDIYMPDLNIGIEYNGLYWHSEATGKGPSYHINKNKLAKSNGIKQVIHIFEDQWRERKDQVKGYLSSKLGINQKIYARDCESCEASAQEAKAFLKQYHIQGAPNSIEYAVGLFYKEKMVGVVTYGKHHRGSGSGQIVLNRLCFKSGLSIVGGAKKLISNSVPSLLKLGYQTVVTWSDNSISDGAVYEACGFTLEHDMKPDYSYIKGPTRYSKQSLKKTAEERTTGKTEHQLRLEQGYFRIWDCGKKRWALPLT